MKESIATEAAVYLSAVYLATGTVCVQRVFNKFVGRGDDN